MTFDLLLAASTVPWPVGAAYLCAGLAAFTAIPLIDRRLP